MLDIIVLHALGHDSTHANINFNVLNVTYHSPNKIYSIAVSQIFETTQYVKQCQVPTMAQISSRVPIYHMHTHACIEPGL